MLKENALFSTTASSIAAPYCSISDDACWHDKGDIVDCNKAYRLRLFQELLKFLHAILFARPSDQVPVSS